MTSGLQLSIMTKLWIRSSAHFTLEECNLSFYKEQCFPHRFSEGQGGGQGSDGITWVPTFLKTPRLVKLTYAIFLMLYASFDIKAQAQLNVNKFMMIQIY